MCVRHLQYKGHKGVVTMQKPHGGMSLCPCSIAAYEQQLYKPEYNLTDNRRHLIQLAAIHAQL